jgi:Flp pilus assembly protein TadD
MRAEVSFMRKILVCTALAFIVAACASTPQQPPSTAKASTPAGCVGTTATRLPVEQNGCAGFGSQYSKDQLDRTGQPYVNDSLRMLDPAVQTHGGP